MHQLEKVKASSRLQVIELLPALQAFPPIVSSTATRQPATMKTPSSTMPRHDRALIGIDWLADSLDYAQLRGIRPRSSGKETQGTERRRSSAQVAVELEHERAKQVKAG